MLGINKTSAIHYGLLTVVVLASFEGCYLLLKWSEKWLKRKKIITEKTSLQRYFLAPLWGILGSTLVPLFLPLLPLPPRFNETISHAAQVTLIIAVAAFLIRAAHFFQILFYSRFDTSIADNMRQRAMRTQLQFVVRLVMIGIGVLAFGAVLFTFQGARQIGASLLASAGVASVVIGFAAQRTLANLIAGFQIAFTQPIRIDDVVIVEGEWGVIEEITLTYVVVKIWDLRRMILPITYFVEKPFQNWTRTTSDLLGYCYFYLDYDVPVDELRKELKRICQQTPLWDGQVAILQVTDLRERVLELRALVSARNAPSAFDLRCEVREKLINFIKEKFPGSLPRTRAEMTNPEYKRDPGERQTQWDFGGATVGP